jgi:hypothetical protein
MHYHQSVRIFRVCVFFLMFPLISDAQIRRPVSAPAQENGDFGSKFFEDLGILFGRLQQSDLDRAFQRAKPARCSDLVGQTGEWKEVAFLNDDRKLGDWHYSNIDDVKRDLAAFVFSGICRGEVGPVKVATSYPVEESYDRFKEGKIPFSKIVINDNDPVSVIFDRTMEAYVFQLPYLYLESQTNSDVVYTLTPPKMISRPETTVSLEFRCKALSDAELTYRFLLCRTRVANRDPHIENQNVKQPLGNAAYYILSDGKEASASVKLDFGGGPDSAAEKAEAQPDQARTLELTPTAVEGTWHPAAAGARLSDIGDGEFRLRFNGQSWNGRIDKIQWIADGVLSTSMPVGNQEYCVWRPGLPDQVNKLLEKIGDDSFLYSLSFRKDLRSATSGIFDIESGNGLMVATMECYFPRSQTPAELTVNRWLSVVGTHVAIEVRRD